MSSKAIALVAPPDNSRLQVARCLRDASYDVTECEELSIVNRFAGVVMIDDETTADAMRMRVQSCLERPHPPRVVVISSRPAAWKTLALAFGDHLIVLAAPSFGWEILDALRASSAGGSRQV